MSLPTEPDFALVKMGDGADPEVFTQICGLTDITINKGANTTDRAVRDCTKPGETPVRRIKTNSKQLDISGSGLANVDEIVRLEAALGKSKNYKIELYKDDGTDAGDLLGTYSGAFVLTADNMGAPRDGVSSGEFSLANNGPWTYAAAA
jgi:hypothetical protein